MSKEMIETAENVFFREGEMKAIQKSISENTEVTEVYSFHQVMKRLFDLVLSVIALVILIPVFLLIIVLILIEDGDNPFFVQERIGLGGRAFNIYKFRSMKKAVNQ